MIISDSDNVSLVLASASPRRKALLKSVGVNFEVLVADIDESVHPEEAPRNYVTRLAQEKASAAQRSLTLSGGSTKAILAADTIVSQGLKIFGKPQSEADARAIWRRLSGTKHQVISAICLQVGEKTQLRVVGTQVHFSKISDAQMTHYWNTGEPADKAGAYAIQGYASAWVQEIYGSHSNVVGLPLFEVNELLTTIDHNWL